MKRLDFSEGFGYDARVNTTHRQEVADSNPTATTITLTRKNHGYEAKEKSKQREGFNAKYPSLLGISTVDSFLLQFTHESAIYEILRPGALCPRILALAQEFGNSLLRWIRDTHQIFQGIFIGSL